MSHISLDSFVLSFHMYKHRVRIINNIVSGFKLVSWFRLTSNWVNLAVVCRIYRCTMNTTQMGYTEIQMEVKEECK